MQLPLQLLESLKGINGFEKEAFEKVHNSTEQITSIRLNPLKNQSNAFFTNSPITIHNRVPWTAYGYYLKERPSFTFDPFFHAGCYYVQEASSMFLEQALKKTTDLTKPLKILDLCAAPGGKSTHIQSLISKNSLLISNEVIKSRTNILKDNIIKWGCENVVVTNNDPKDFTTLENFFDVLVIDAPCSGSGLFRRDIEATGEWSLNNVEFCSQRQQRILADAWPSLKKNGILIYCTCSYSREENEEIVDWLSKQFAIDYFPLSIDPSWKITDTSEGYRFWPDKLKGEGFFIACFRKRDGGEFFPEKIKYKPELLNKKEIELLKRQVKADSHLFFKSKKLIYAVPENLSADISAVLRHLFVHYFGTACGELIREKFVPDHALAMSQIVNEDVEKHDLDFEDAILFLQKKNIHKDPGEKGWKLVTYRGCKLGWVNVLDSRVNNYYPKSLRILKEV